MRSNYFLMLALALACTGVKTAKAYNQWTDGYSVCNSESFFSEKNRCLSIVSGKAFNPAALAVCASQSFDSEKNSCLETIVGRTFGYEATQVCASESFASEKTSCLASIANQYLDAAATSVCATQSYDSDKNSCLRSIIGKQFAAGIADACKSFTFASEKTSCLSKVAGKNYDFNALAVCRTLSYDSDKLSCFSAIENKSYFQGELQVCAGLYFASDKNSCLSRAGRYFAPQPPVYVPAPPVYVPAPPVVVVPRPQPRPQQPSGSCGAIARDVSAACGFSRDVESYLASRASYCDTAESDSGKTHLNAFVKGGDLVVINTRGERTCKINRFQLAQGGGVAYLNTVRGKRRSDKVFLRMNYGQLYYMDMGMDLFEVKNDNDRSYNIKRFDDLGNETIQLTHAAGNVSTLTFDQIDQRRRTGRVEPIRPVELPGWATILQILGW